jgi:acetyl-CoA synthetase
VYREIGWVTDILTLSMVRLPTARRFLCMKARRTIPNPTDLENSSNVTKINILSPRRRPIRAFIKMGASSILSNTIYRLRLLGKRRADQPEAWMWYHTIIGKEMPDC